MNPNSGAEVAACRGARFQSVGLPFVNRDSAFPACRCRSGANARRVAPLSVRLDRQVACWADYAPFNSLLAHDLKSTNFSRTGFASSVVVFILGLVAAAQAIAQPMLSLSRSGILTSTNPITNGFAIVQWRSSLDSNRWVGMQNVATSNQTLAVAIPLSFPAAFFRVSWPTNSLVDPSLVGKWIGTDEGPYHVAGLFVTFNADGTFISALETNGFPVGVTGTFTTDTNMFHRQMNKTYDEPIIWSGQNLGTNFLGIYEVSGDRLTDCEDPHTRPSDFQSYGYRIWRRPP